MYMYIMHLSVSIVKSDTYSLLNTLDTQKTC